MLSVNTLETIMKENSGKGLEKFRKLSKNYETDINS